MGAFAFLLFLETVRVAAGWALGADNSALTGLKYLFRVGLVAMLLLNFTTITKAVMESFTQLGLIAGGGALTLPQFLDPDAYVNIGIRIGKVLMDAYVAHLGWTSFVTAFPYIIAWLFFELAYVWMALTV